MDKLRRLGQAVTKAVKPIVTRNLMVTNTATSAVLFTSGDAIQQRIEKSMGHKNRYDYGRSGRRQLFLLYILTKYCVRIHVHKVQQYAVGPAESQLDLILATAPSCIWRQSVVLFVNVASAGLEYFAAVFDSFGGNLFGQLLCLLVFRRLQPLHDHVFQWGPAVWEVPLLSGLCQCGRQPTFVAVKTLSSR